jgi:hypothetical protein
VVTYLNRYKVVGKVSFLKLNNFTQWLVVDTFRPLFYKAKTHIRCEQDGSKPGMNRMNHPDLLPYCSNIIMKNIYSTEFIII